MKVTPDSVMAAHKAAAAGQDGRVACGRGLRFADEQSYLAHRDGLYVRFTHLRGARAGLAAFFRTLDRTSKLCTCCGLTVNVNHAEHRAADEVEAWLRRIDRWLDEQVRIAYVVCDSCKGSGSADTPGRPFYPCPTCKGDGRVPA